MIRSYHLCLQMIGKILKTLSLSKKKKTKLLERVEKWSQGLGHKENREGLAKDYKVSIIRRIRVSPYKVQTVKSPPAMQEIQFLSQEDPLE